jgi:REP element-mobilizing transposase RayT
MFDREKEIEYKNYRVGSLRLPEFDYTQPGFYFVTIVTHKHKSLFGKIINEKVVLSDFGNLITEYWLNIPIHFDNVKLDEFIVMPNHIHGIIQLIDDPSINVETQSRLWRDVSTK